MKLALPLLVVALLVGSQGEPIGKTLTHIIQGGQTLANMAMVTGARAVAPFVDAFVQTTQRFMMAGKRYMMHLDAMLTHMDVDPQMKLMAESMHMNLYDIETAMDGLMQNTVWGGEVVKATADCVVPQYDAVTKVKETIVRSISTSLEAHRSAFKVLTSAGSSITEQMDSLQDMEDKITMMIASGQGLEAMQYAIKNRQKTEKDGHAIEAVYFNALDEYREANTAAVKKMSDELGQVYEEGDAIMAKLDACIEPKIMKMLRQEIQMKKKTGSRRVIPEHIHFLRSPSRSNGQTHLPMLHPMPKPTTPPPVTTPAVRPVEQTETPKAQ